MQALAVLADPVRRAIVERLATGPASAGDIAQEFPISRPAVSRHLRLLREAGLVHSETIAQQRIYRLSPEPFDELDQWVRQIRTFWSQHLDALETEIARGHHARSS